MAKPAQPRAQRSWVCACSYTNLSSYISCTILRCILSDLISLLVGVCIILSTRTWSLCNSTDRFSNWLRYLSKLKLKAWNLAALLFSCTSTTPFCTKYNTCHTNVLKLESVCKNNVGENFNLAVLCVSPISPNLVYRQI